MKHANKGRTIIHSWGRKLGRREMLTASWGLTICLAWQPFLHFRGEWFFYRKEVEGRCYSFLTHPGVNCVNHVLCLTAFSPFQRGFLSTTTTNPTPYPGKSDSASLTWRFECLMLYEVKLYRLIKIKATDYNN